MTILIHVNQYNTDKENLKKMIGDVDKKMRDVGCLVTSTTLNTNINKVKNTSC